MTSLQLISPAKINLYLKVIRRRRDGYHELVTLFHRLALADTLRLTKKSEGFLLRSSNPKLPTGETNLITKAFRVLQEKCPRLKGVSVFLKKRIPVSAGLGGGSSNAATFLLGMNRLYGLRLSKNELLALGKKLGADVPFFIHQETQALGTNRGDQLKKRPFSGRLYFLLVVSNKGLSTKLIFKSLPQKLPAVSLTKTNRAARLLCNSLKAKDLQQISTALKNDLEGPAFRIRPSLRRIVAKIKQLGIPATAMSGSGPTIFAILSQPQKAKQLAEKLRKVLPSKKILLTHSF